MKSKLIRALKDGPLRTGDLDEAMLGFVFLPGFSGVLAPYGLALAELISEHRVVWWIADDSDVWYSLRPKPWQIAARWNLSIRVAYTGGELQYEA